MRSLSSNLLHGLGQDAVEGVAIQAEGLIDEGTSLKDRFAVVVDRLLDRSIKLLVEAGDLPPLS